MTHVIYVRRSGGDDRVDVYCSCGAVIGDFTVTTLDELNRIAHEHIEGADRAPLIR